MTEVFAFLMSVCRVYIVDSAGGRANVCEDGGAIASQIPSCLQSLPTNFLLRLSTCVLHDTMFLEGIQHPVVILMGKILLQGFAVTKSARENVFNALQCCWQSPARPIIILWWFLLLTHDLPRQTLTFQYQISRTAPQPFHISQHLSSRCWVDVLAQAEAAACPFQALLGRKPLHNTQPSLPSSCPASMPHRQADQTRNTISCSPLLPRQENVFDFQSITANANKWSDWRNKIQRCYRWAFFAADIKVTFTQELLRLPAIRVEVVASHIKPVRFTFNCCSSQVNSLHDSSTTGRRTRYTSQSSTTRSSVNLLSKVSIRVRVRVE